MIDFIYRLNDIIPSWPAGMRWTLAHVSQVTQTSVPHILQYLSEALGKEFDVTGMISCDEAVETINVLSQKIRPEIEERERQIAQRRAYASQAYERLLDKLHVMQSMRNWHSAFRSITYFAGEHQNDLSRSVFVSLCSEAVRAGLKSKANMQELGQWLQKGVAAAMCSHSKEGVEEALDLIDAYGSSFLADETGKGQLLLGSTLAMLEESAARYELWEQYKQLVNQLYPME